MAPHADTYRHFLVHPPFPWAPTHLLGTGSWAVVGAPCGKAAASPLVPHSCPRVDLPSQPGRADGEVSVPPGKTERVSLAAAQALEEAAALRPPVPASEEEGIGVPASGALSQSRCPAPARSSSSAGPGSRLLTSSSRLTPGDSPASSSAPLPGPTSHCCVQQPPLPPPWGDRARQSLQGVRGQPGVSWSGLGQTPEEAQIEWSGRLLSEAGGPGAGGAGEIRGSKTSRPWPLGLSLPQPGPAQSWCHDLGPAGSPQASLPRARPPLSAHRQVDRVPGTQGRGPAGAARPAPTQWVGEPPSSAQSRPLRRRRAFCAQRTVVMLTPRKRAAAGASDLTPDPSLGLSAGQMGLGSAPAL